MLCGGDWNKAYALLHNESPGEKHWLTVALTGGGAVNRDAAGARVYVTGSDGVTQMREVILGSSLGAGHDPRLHFGLGEARVDVLRVVWPDGLEQTFHDVARDQILALTYVNGAEDADVATRWFELALDLVKEIPGFTPPVASRAFAYLGVTLYESVAPGMDGYASLAGATQRLATPSRPRPGRALFLAECGEQRAGWRQPPPLRRRLARGAAQDRRARGDPGAALRGRR